MNVASWHSAEGTGAVVKDEGGPRLSRASNCCSRTISFHWSRGSGTRWPSRNATRWPPAGGWSALKSCAPTLVPRRCARAGKGHVATTFHSCSPSRSHLKTFKRRTPGSRAIRLTTVCACGMVPRRSSPQSSPAGDGPDRRPRGLDAGEDRPDSCREARSTDGDLAPSSRCPNRSEDRRRGRESSG